MKFQFKEGQWFDVRKLTDWQKQWCSENLEFLSMSKSDFVEENFNFWIYREWKNLGYYFGPTTKPYVHSENEITFNDFFWGEEEITRGLIFDNPKWVTAINTDLEAGLVEGKDYKVYKVEEDRYWVYNDVQSPHPVWYYKGRFHKVTYEDLLPEKDTPEDKEGSFEDLVIDYCVLNYRNYIVRSKFSEEQLRFMQKVLPPYSYMTVSDTFEIAILPFHEANELSFNDIFKHKSEV